MPNETRLNDGADGLEIAHPEDFGISRDDDGELLPVKQRIPGTEMAIRVKPLVGGAYDRWEDILEGKSDETDRVDALFKERIDEGIGAQGIDEVPDYVVPGLVQAIKNSSGHEVFRAVEEQETKEQMAQMEAMDSDVVENLIEKSMDERMNGADDPAADDLAADTTN